MGNFYMESTQINYRRDEKTKTVDQKLRELSETSAIDTDIAPVFKSTNTYQPGDMVYYRNKLYVFNVEHTGTWAAADVTATDVTTEISSLKSGLTSLNTVATGNYGGFNIYKIGKIVLMVRGDGSVNTDASGQVLSDGVPLQLPESLRPIDIINIVETYANKRVTIEMDGTITLPNDPSASNLIIRLSAVWMTFN